MKSEEAQRCKELFKRKPYFLRQALHSERERGWNMQEMLAALWKSQSYFRGLCSLLNGLHSSLLFYNASAAN